MPIQPGVWGIDLGQCALKAVRIEEIDGTLTATAFDYVEHPKILSQPDADPDQLTREALEKFLSRNTLRGDVVAISVPGQSGLARFVKLPPVEEKKIADIVRFEAKQQIPFNLDEVVWDYQKIGSGDVSDGFAMNIEIGLFAMKRDMINRYLQHFKDVGVEVHFVQMAPLALCNFVSYDLLGKGAAVKGEEEPKTNCVVALDIGADSSNLVITDANRVIWQRPIPLGGNHFTRALTKELKLTFAKAEHLKRNAMKSPDLKKILTALKPVLNDFVGEVQRSLGYFTNTHRDAQVEYMIGLGNAFRLPGLQRYLGEKLQMEVRKLNKMDRLSGEAVLTQPAFSENAMTFGVAYGLALQGLKQARLMTNLLPGEIRMERMVRAKKPWAVAAAALLLIGPGAMAFKTWREAHVYLNPDVHTAITSADGIAKDLTKWQGEYDQAQVAAYKERDAVRSIVAGQSEFKNWLELNTFLTQCLPQPNGTNLAEGKIKDLYWVRTPERNRIGYDREHGVEPMSGAKAFDELNKRLAGKTTPSLVKDDFGTGIDDLVQINIEHLDARFTDDLAGFWNALDNTQKNEENVRPKEQAKAGPTGKGWVIEIQGYTYHNQDKNFIRDTLLETLAAKGITETAAPTTTATPLPIAPGGKAPVTPPPAASPGGKVAPGEVDIPPTGPVLNRISHVILYKATIVKDITLSNAPFATLTGKAFLPEILKSSGAPASPGAAMMKGPPGPPAPGGSNPGGAPAAPAPNLRDSWSPVGSTGTAGSGPGGVSGRGDNMPRPGATTGTSAGNRETGNRDAAASGGPEVRHLRTEFVIFFVWHEPTPSAPLRREEDAAAGAIGVPPPPPAPGAGR
jgi:type IV pilus assembly protein PilM